MRVLVGLGNPGEKYRFTRHNAGFLFLDYLARRLEVSFRPEKSFRAEVAEARQGDQKILLVKPETFMNNSGEAVAAILRYYQLGPENLTVIHDDLDIAPGTFRSAVSSRSAGHNGVQSVMDVLGTEAFTRIRIGIGRPDETLGFCQPAHDYVLSPLQKSEQESLEALFPEIQNALGIEP